ncbi:MAG: hypothetical protein ACAI35_14125 [Candidatus Methylacidiphilales bacterium]|nr:hypothetical protein [Candidatus Methylacidiphilales bacterium]
MPTASVVGVYPVAGPEPCHFIELAIQGGEGIFDLCEVTQPVTGMHPSEWQCPLDERLISADGNTVLTESFESEDDESLWHGDFRLGFFFHYLDQARALRTPFGELALPAETPFPERLSEIDYEEH